MADKEPQETGKSVPSSSGQHEASLILGRSLNQTSEEPQDTITGIKQEEQPEGQKQRKRFKDLNLYNIIKPYARNIKTLFQMIIGCSIAVFIIYELVYDIFHPIPISVLTIQTLGTVGVALVISTAFELAYTLFTDGPDEAVEPLITGLAAVILVVISKITAITFDMAGGVALLVLALILLFILRYFFIEEHGLKSIYNGKHVDTQQRRASARNSKTQPPPSQAINEAQNASSNSD